MIIVVIPFGLILFIAFAIASPWAAFALAGIYILYKLCRLAIRISGDNQRKGQIL